MYLSERGRVVDAVPHHGHRVALGLELFDLIGLVGRKHLGEDVRDLDLARDGLRRAQIVPSSGGIDETSDDMKERMQGCKRAYPVTIHT